jgi:hypothetical protein
MPNPTQFVGQCVAYRIDPGKAAVGAGAGALVEKTGETSAANLMVGQDPRNLVGGTPWNFTFLKYNAGEVTTCPLGAGVLTGPFSGCYTFRYRDRAGAQKIAHVGTDNTPTSPGTIRAKQIWQAMVADGATGISGEAPSKVIMANEQFQIAQANQNQLPQLCAYFEGTSAWAILFISAVAGVTVIPGVLRLALVRSMPLLDWSAVRAMREFR